MKLFVELFFCVSLLIGALYLKSCMEFASAQVPQKEVSQQLRFNSYLRTEYPDVGVCDLRFHQLSDVPKPTSGGQCLKSGSSVLTNYEWGACGTGGGSTGGTGIPGGTILSTLNWPSSPGSAGQPLLLSRARDEMIFGSMNITQMADVADRLPTSGIKYLGYDHAQDSSRLLFLDPPAHTVYLNRAQSVDFQIPVLGDTTLTNTTANVPVFHNISSFTGTGLSGVVTTSTVNGIGRITFLQAGYVNLHFLDEVQITSSTAGGSGSLAEFVGMIAHYGSDGVSKDTFPMAHSIQDPITSAVRFPFEKSTGLLFVEANDYFTFNFAFNSSIANRNVRFQLPADSPGLDERFGFLFFALSDIVPTGPQGPAGPQGPKGDTGDSTEGRLIATENTPTDLTPYADGQIIPVNTPTPGVFLEVTGADSGERHGFAVDFEAQSNNPLQSSWTVGTDLNYGYSSFGNIYGKLYTEDRGRPFNATNTPIMRIQITLEVTSVPAGANRQYGFTSTLTVLIRKTSLTPAPNTLFVRFYTGTPSNTNEVDTVEFMKATDNPSHDYHTYLERTGTTFTTEVTDILGIKTFRVFTSNPPTNNQTSNPLNFHSAKSTKSFGPTQTPAPANWATSGNTTNTIPTSKICTGGVHTTATLPSSRTEGLLYCTSD